MHTNCKVSLGNISKYFKHQKENAVGISTLLKYSMCWHEYKKRTGAVIHSQAGASQTVISGTGSQPTHVKQVDQRDDFGNLHLVKILRTILGNLYSNLE